MDSKVKSDWLVALRSGEYKQGTAALRTGDKFCCLGVLCDLYDKAQGGESNWLEPHHGHGGLRGFYINGSEDESYLPPEVRDWAGLDTNDGLIPGPLLNSSTLASMNDQGVSFLRIAEVIEERF